MTRWGVIGCRVVLGALFLWAAATKVPDMNAFAQELANYRLLPAVLVPWAASAVVGVEIVAGLALVTGFAVRAAAVVIAGLLLAFIAFLSQALLRGLDLRCGCFGGGSGPVSWATVARDLAMLAAALLVAWRPEVRQSAARQAAARAAR